MDLNIASLVSAVVNNTDTEKFYQEIVEGLSAEFKFLPSKYFYDQQGDKLFQQIMACEDYYLTRCETEIFRTHTAGICNTMMTVGQGFDIIELGAGDGTKTALLLGYLTGKECDFRYLPIDISGHILSQLEQDMKTRFPGIDMKTMEGEYLDMLAEATFLSERPKIVMFLGANVGNMLPEKAHELCSKIRKVLRPGDLVFIGFDLKKNPQLIRSAYSDSEGITRAFNLNLLRRLNSELGANFDLSRFEHYCSYDPHTGSCKSYLVSIEKQFVTFSQAQFELGEGEQIWMEVSQKYSINEIAWLASTCGFTSVDNFLDSKGWFVDAMWRAI